MSSKEIKTSEHVLSTVSKTIIMYEHCQNLTNNVAKLMQHDNND